MLSEVSEKQLEVLTVPFKRFNVLVGVTGSGKSFIANYRFYAELVTMKKGSAVLLTGNTKDSVYKNVIREILVMDEGIGDLEYKPHLSLLKVRGEIDVFCVGINSEGAEDKIQGGSVDLWYADEPTTYPKTAFNMCSSRCRGPGEDGDLEEKPILMTLNPDFALHYIKTDIIDKRSFIPINYWEFGFTDNPKMGQKMIDSLRAQYTGEFAERMIEGKWTEGQGRRVIPEFDEKAEEELVKEIERPIAFDYYTSIDPGFKDNTGILFGYYHFDLGVYIIEDEILLKSPTTDVIAVAIKEREETLFGKDPFLRVSDTDLRMIADLSRLHGLHFIPTQKDNKDAQINFFRTLINTRCVLVHPRCKNLIYQMRVGMWDKAKRHFERTDETGHLDLIDTAVYLLRNIDKTINPYENNQIPHSYQVIPGQDEMMGLEEIAKF